jgi:hypothetical protein
MSKEIEVGVTIYDVYLTVSGYYHPEEPEEMYDDNMEGYPGCNAEFELQSIMLEGIVITDIISDEVYNMIIDKVIENQQL